MDLFEYDQIFYNQVIYDLEQTWSRKLTDHEISVLLYGYRHGRKTEMEDEHAKLQYIVIEKGNELGMVY